jgi:hypothetical protein
MRFSSGITILMFLLAGIYRTLVPFAQSAMLL